MLDILAPQLPALLYVLLATSDALAAAEAWRSPRAWMARHFVVSAILHGMVALCHLLHA